MRAAIALLLLVAGVGCGAPARTMLVVTEVHYEITPCGARRLTVTRCTQDGYYCETLTEPDRVTGEAVHP